MLNTTPGFRHSRKYDEKNMSLKPFGFCCSIHSFDPLTKYDQQKSQYKSSLMSISAINESPVLKFQAQFAGYLNNEQKKRTLKNKPFDIADQKHKTYMKHKQNLGPSQNGHKQYKSQNVHDQYESHNPHNDPHNLGDHTHNISKGHKQPLRNSQNVHTLYKSHNPSDDQDNVEDLYDERVMRLLRGPLQWYLEDEIAAAKDIVWEQRQKAHNEQMDKNVQIGKQKLELLIKKEINTYPRWYQDFSIDQMKNLMMLQSVIYKDCEEMVTGRTQRTLVTIGVISTFFTLAPDVIKKLQKSSNCSAIEFLRETYKILTGNYFEEEEYKQFYDCNERIILSAIAFLTLPEAVVELHKRLPPVITPKLPPKPMSPTSPVRQKMESPYEEELFVRPDWASYYNDLQQWKEQCKLIPIPKIILPPTDCILTNYKNTNTNSDGENSERNELRNLPQYNKTHDIESNPSVPAKRKRNTSAKEEERKNISTNLPVKAEEKASTNTSTNNPTEEKPKLGRISTKRKHSTDRRNEELKQEVDIADNTGSGEEKVVNDSQNLIALDIPRVPDQSKVFDFTINGISDKPGPVEYKICGVLQPPQPNQKSWLGEKHAHYIISGAADEPPTCPVTYEMTGIANVTPTNSDERFFSVLKLGDGPNKIYPSGRNNLSPKWQEWLQNADEEFRKVESKANKMIKSIEAITKLVFPGPMCDSCCSCRQTRKSYIKAKETKSPYLVVDTLTEDNNKNKYIVGSMAMHSPAPTPPESTVNLLEVIASEDVLTTNVLINGVTNEKGETQYFISGVKKDMIRVPARIVERPPPRPPRNVPPCACAIQQILKKGLTPTTSHDHIPWTKEDGLCFGKKFRPNEYPAYSCKMYPGDKSCRRNPFMHEIAKLKRKAEREKQKKEREMSPSKEKKMYSIADFQPCGDEHGLHLCRGPWGALYTLTPEELEEQERLRKEILRGPPCGTRPGRAVCEGPFGERIPMKRPQIEIEEIAGEGDEDLEDEEEVEEEEEAKPAPVTAVKKKERTQDEKCYVSPESIASRKKVVKKKVEKFIPDPNYPGYDDPWNIFRTAPSEKESETDFKKLLKLSSPKPPATPVESKVVIDEGEKVDQPSLQKDTSDSVTKKDTLKGSTKDSRKTSPAVIKTTPTRMSKSPASAKPKSDEKISKKKSKLIDKKDTIEIPPKSSGIPAKIEKTSDKIMGDKADSEIGKEKLLKPKESKYSHKKVNEKTTGQTSKPVLENIKLKSAQEKIDTFPKKLSQRSDSRIKQDEKAISKKPKNSEVKIDIKTIIHHNRSSKRSNTKSENSFNIKINKEGREGKVIKKVHHKQHFSVDTGKTKVSKVIPLKRSTKRDKKKDVQIIQDEDSIALQKKQILGLKNLMTSSELYPYDVQPVDLPEEPPPKCTVEYEDEEDTKDSVQVDEEADTQLLSKGPCGWRTKSEQQLPTKKTLVYLTEPDHPIETIPVRPGGKPCICRENRATKKILLYNIGGLIGGKKDDAEAAIQKKLLKKKKDEDDKKMQVIDGAIYYTPPPSPRRSDEYVPEYDLYESPYDMCLSQRKDNNLKFFERYNGPKDLIAKGLKNIESCGCNEYVDTYGIQLSEQDNEKEEAIKELNKARQELMEAASPKESWKLALKDVGLIDYFTRCRDSMPCWLKCAKFNKIGCSLRHRKLKLKRPVCECKYERKILENKEEKRKWKERRQRLKSLKKQPFMNVVNVSKPVVADTKLMISGVKRIPREDEYIDDVKYCITGVAENYSELPPKQVVGGVQLSTPIHTPEQSVEELPCVCLHRHWSPTNIPPGPLPKEEEILRAEKERRRKEAEETYKQIYAPLEVYDTHTHSCKTPCNVNSSVENDTSMERNDKVSIQDDSNKVPPYVQKSTTDDKVKHKVKNKVLNPSKQMKPQLELSTNKSKNESGTKNVIIQKAETSVKSLQKESKNVRNEASIQKSVNNPKKPEYKKTVTDDFSPTHPQNETVKSNPKNIETSDKENNESSNNTKTDLMTIAQNELEKMAVEGFLFAKLPKCFLLPQLQYWLMYRKGFTLTNMDKNNSVCRSVMMWNTLDAKRLQRIQPLPLQLTKLQLRELTFEHAEEMKEKIAKKKEIFHSQVRKERVLYSQSMWNTMDYGKFPSTSFKMAYFTYMANKEADGHVFKPWHPFEIREV